MHYTGMGIVCENADFCGSETDFPWRKKLSEGKEISSTRPPTPKASVFSLAPNTSFESFSFESIPLPDYNMNTVMLTVHYNIQEYNILIVIDITYKACFDANTSS